MRRTSSRIEIDDHILLNIQEGYKPDKNFKQKDFDENRQNKFMMASFQAC